jgi:hypothetical protein
VARNLLRDKGISCYTSRRNVLWRTISHILSAYRQLTVHGWIFQQPHFADVSKTRALPEGLLIGSQAQSMVVKLLHPERLTRPVVTANLAVVQHVWTQPNCLHIIGRPTFQTRSMTSPSYDLDWKSDLDFHQSVVGYSVFLLAGESQPLPGCLHLCSAWWADLRTLVYWTPFQTKLPHLSKDCTIITQQVS